MDTNDRHQEWTSVNNQEHTTALNWTWKKDYESEKAMCRVLRLQDLRYESTNMPTHQQCARTVVCSACLQVSDTLDATNQTLRTRRYESEEAMCHFCNMCNSNCVNRISTNVKEQ